jgi:hypothetical protein
LHDKKEVSQLTTEIHQIDGRLVQSKPQSHPSRAHKFSNNADFCECCCGGGDNDLSTLGLRLVIARWRVLDTITYILLQVVGGVS